MTYVALTYLDRAAWQAKPLPRLGHVVPRAQFRGLALHHTVSVLHDWDGDGVLHGDLDDIRRFMQQLQTIRPDLGLDVPYSFVVLQGSTPDDAVICEGRGFDRTGAHTHGHNSTRWGVALEGNYTGRHPTPGQLEAVRWIGRQLTDPHAAWATIGHRDVAATACPGALASAQLHEIQPPFAPIGGDEMLTPDQNAKLDAIYTAVARRDYDGDGQLDTGWLADVVEGIRVQLDPRGEGTIRDALHAMHASVLAAIAQVDRDQASTIIAGLDQAQLAAIAKAVNDELARRVAS